MKIVEGGDEIALSSFFDSLKAHHQIPFAMGDSVCFLYKGEATAVSWGGDFNGWYASDPSFSGERIGTSDVFLVDKIFPSDARLDYKVIVDGSWKLDPGNSYRQFSGFGPNSELRMPDYEYPTETILGENVIRGLLGWNFIIHSKPENLNYDVQYRVYTPANYDELSDLPVIYVTDGHEYSNEFMGSMLTVLDNLIFEEKIKPIIAVFIDPRNPFNVNENRRATEYTGNINFANFVADELVPAIDEQYRTLPDPSARAILGASYGGWNAAYFGLKRSDTFHLIAAHSPAFYGDILPSYEASDPLPLKFFISTGVFYDTQYEARTMKEILEEKGNELLYVEVNEGHSWGNWRALIEEPLVYFFPN